MIDYEVQQQMLYVKIKSYYVFIIQHLLWAIDTLICTANQWVLLLFIPILQIKRLRFSEVEKFELKAKCGWIVWYVNYYLTKAVTK